MEIVFPEQSIADNAIVMISHSVKAMKTKEDIGFNLTKVNFIDPFSIALLAGTIVFCKNRKLTRELRYTAPLKKSVNDYLSQVGFKRFFSVTDQGIHRTTCVELKQLSIIQPLHIQLLIDFLGKRVSLSEEVKGSLKMSLQEILTNVFDHSRSKIGCFICAQHYPTMKRIQLSIADFGVGIRRTLPKKYPVTDDCAAILLATESGVTSRQQKAGLGLNHIRNVAKKNGGKLSIVSGMGMVDFVKERPVAHKLKALFPGTIVTLDIKTDKGGYRLIGEESTDIF